MAECPVCGSDVQPSGEVIENELLDCADCGTTLEVLKIDPLQLGVAPEEEEDWGE